MQMGLLALCMLSIITLSYGKVLAIEINSTYISTSNVSKNLKLSSNAVNDTGNLMNSTAMLYNKSNLTSNQMIISNNKVLSSITSNNSSGNSIIKDEIKTINGVCNSDKVGGNGNDTLASSGKCNDELTGGSGADKFVCGEGTDTIRDFNSEEGDVIIDRQNCEKIL
jgi:Ca2+-binding RTX toxin-like protein